MDVSGVFILKQLSASIVGGFPRGPQQGSERVERTQLRSCTCTAVQQCRTVLYCARHGFLSQNKGLSFESANEILIESKTEANICIVILLKTPSVLPRIFRYQDHNVISFCQSRQRRSHRKCARVVVISRLPSVPNWPQRDGSKS